MRQRFTGDSADAKAALIIKSEGRCLRTLGSLPLDERTVAILCRRTALTTLLVQNFAKWPPTPPALLRFLAKHPMVRRNQGLRNRLLKHPNCPSDTKRG